MPIEEIVEFDLGLDVVPLPNLHRDFQIESWLSHDTKSIFVDLRQCEEMETRRPLSRLAIGVIRGMAGVSRRAGRRRVCRRRLRMD